MLLFSYSHEICCAAGNSRYGQEPFPSSGVRHIENRNLRASKSSRWRSRISGYVLKVFQYATSEFQRPSLSKWGKVHNLSCENEFYLHCWSPNLVLKQRPGELGNGLLSLLPLLVFKFLVASADPSEFAAFLISRVFSSSRHSSSSSFRCLLRPLPLWLPRLSIVISL